MPILLRGDSGLARDELMTWGEAHGVDYLFGLAKHARLLARLARPMEQARLRYEITGQAARVFADFRDQTRDRWRRARRVVGKAEHVAKGANPRLVVTSLGWWEVEARALYEERYCARGEMENRIQEQPLDRFADRTSTGKLKANQVRRYFSALA